jgi:hypothetical protein
MQYQPPLERTKRRVTMSKVVLDLSELNDEDSEAMVRVFEAFRRSRKGEAPRRSFADFREKVKATRSPMTEEEADALAAEAVAFARGQQ